MKCWKMNKRYWKNHGSHHGRHSSRGSSGNSAFDDYREETLKRLEDEQVEFENYLDRLRQAKDKSEFDQFMDERRNAPPSSDDSDHRPGA